MRFDEAKVRQAIDIIHGNELFELRYMIGKKVYSGYFKGADKLVQELAWLPEDGGNVYITINDINDTCYNREQRDTLKVSKITTSDDNIDGYKHLLIDLDPIRPSGTGSTNAQLAAAHTKAAEIYKYLKRENFPDPIIALSGNGWHLLYKIALDKTPDRTELIKNCLRALDMLFSDSVISVDTSVFNPARICKLYGTYACKGANTEDTPHRLAEIRYIPEEVKEVPLDRLKWLAGNAPQKEKPQTTYTGQPVPELKDLAQWISDHNVPVREVVHSGGTTRYILECCPFNSEHRNKDAAFFQMADGSFGFHCFHNSCSDKHWKEARVVYEPDAYTRLEPDTSLKPNHASVTYRTDGIEQAFTDNPETPKDKPPVFYTLQDILALPQVPEEYIPTGTTWIDRTLGGLKKGLVTCVSGLRGSGKSSILSQWVLNATLIGGAKAAMFSGELTAQTAADWFFRQASGKKICQYSKFEAKYYVRDKDKEKIADKIADKVYIYNNDYGNNYDRVIREMVEVVKTKKVDLLVLDNLMSLDINCLDSRDKYHAQSLFVERLEVFAKKANVHIIFVAHPRKAVGFLRLDDISGSGDIINRVDNAVIVHRRNKDFLRLSAEMFRYGSDEKKLYVTPPADCGKVGNVVEICKDRENGTQDVFIPLYFDKQRKRLQNAEDEVVDYGIFEKEDESNE